MANAVKTFQKNILTILVAATIVIFSLFGKTSGEDFSGAYDEASNASLWNQIMTHFNKGTDDAILENDTEIIPEPAKKPLYLYLKPQYLDEAGNIRAYLNHDDNNGIAPVKHEYIYTAVDDSYFDDALFIGDSRMDGLYMYGHMDNATFYTKVSMSIFSLMNSSTDSSDVRSIRQGLTDNKFGKIYIKVGINEVGIGDTDYFINAYKEVIEEIQQLQPDAIIIIQSILHVTKRQDSQNTRFKNSTINIRNEALKELADNRHVFYIDINSVYDDENGNLPSAYSGDNIHIKAGHYEEWKTALYSNGIVEVVPDKKPEEYKNYRKRLEEIRYFGNESPVKILRDRLSGLKH